MKEWWKKFQRKVLKRDGAMRWLFWIGLAGVVLIAFSEWNIKKPNEETLPMTVSAWQVEQALEQRVSNLLAEMDGVGTCRVMVTLESGVQTVYAADSHVVSGEGEQSTDTAFLRVDTATGPVGLKLTEIQPTIKGVVVVCAGGGNPEVCQRVIRMVATAFHISERRVCVAKQN